MNNFKASYKALLSCSIFFAQISLASPDENAAEDQSIMKVNKNIISLNTKIVGNQEQPEVIYILPWDQIDAPAPSYKPIQQLVNGQFEPLDRDEWRRKIDLHKTIQGVE